ncbi:MAG TPA: phosphoribosyltransferase family protein [Dactylosporangium sp.]|jgi:putative phosphoribosyl transferase|nr:phosphoribosyltransferase family protein [Dactylosporangium sp.]
MQFTDREEAGRHLGGRLQGEAAPDAVVLGVPGGGVPVAIEVAAALDVPLEPLVVQRLGVPFQLELAMGALAPGGVLAVNAPVLRAARVDGDELASEVDHARICADDRSRWLHAGRETLELRGRPAIVVDDAIVTGATARAACGAARAAGATSVVMATPVAGRAGLAGLAGAADRVIHLEAIADGEAAGGRYADFRPVPDDEVVRLLAGPSSRSATPHTGHGDPPEADGRLAVPERATGMVVLAHTSRLAEDGPRYRWIAGRLRDAGLATLSLNLLHEDEEMDWRAAHDVPRLAARLDAGLQRLRADATLSALPVGVFATGNATAAALSLATGPGGGPFTAIVSHDGRPDLAWPALPRVGAPTMLIAGGRDEHLLELNRAAFGRLPPTGRLAVLRDAGHLVQEPGALATLTELATAWFADRLAGGVPAPR